MHLLTLLSIFLLNFVPGLLNPDFDPDQCFCKLQGAIDDCTCSVDTVDYFNNAKIYPRLKSLLVKDYFRFFKVNLKKSCPFWEDDGRCAMKHCTVKPCSQNEIPAGLKGDFNRLEHRGEPMHVKYTQQAQEGGCDSELDELGYLNTTISADAYKEFELWQAHDDVQDNYCTLPDDDGEAEYVDLLLNPERYTGYKGLSAHRIWRSIYLENCFRPKDETYRGFMKASNLNGLCLEKRAFYRAVSGLHASINIHLCSMYLFQGTVDFGGLSALKGAEGYWGPNLSEFKTRFSPETTNGEGPQWLKNLYFVYLLELRAIDKATNYLEKELYYTGNDEEDRDTRAAIKDLLSVVKSFPNHFNESSMFNGGSQALKLKEEFRQHFHNISQIMDCVGCEKCKLWGKLQTQGLGTALKILFSGKFDKLNDRGLALPSLNRRFRLERSEIVALFNAIGRLSTSIHALETFREMMR